MDRGDDRVGFELPRWHRGSHYPLSGWQCRSDHACHPALGHRLRMPAADSAFAGGAFLRTVFRPLQHRDRLYDRGPRQSGAGDVAAPHHGDRGAARYRAADVAEIGRRLHRRARRRGRAGLWPFGSSQWIAGIYLGVGGGALAFILWVMALERATPTRVANTMTVNPVAAGLLATQLVGEPITLNLVLGLGAVFAGIWIATTEVGKP